MQRYAVLSSHGNHRKHRDFPTDDTDGHGFSHTEITENTEFFAQMTQMGTDFLTYGNHGDFPTDDTDGHRFSHTEITEITEKMSANYQSFLSVFFVISV